MDKIQTIFKEINRLAKLRKQAQDNKKMIEAAEYSNQIKSNINDLKKQIKTLTLLLNQTDEQLVNMFQQISNDLNSYDTASQEEKLRICQCIQKRADENQWLRSLPEIMTTLNKCGKSQ